MVVNSTRTPHQGNVLWHNASIALISGGFERLAMYSISGPLTFFLTLKLGFDSYTAQQLQTLFQSVIYLMPMIGAVIADAFQGRYLVCVIALSFAGMGTLVLMVGINQDLKGLTIVALYMFFAAPIAVVNTNLQVLGADQFDERNPLHKRPQEMYFSAYYWVSNVASFFAYSIMTQIAEEGMGVVDTSWSFSFVSGCTLISLLLSLLVLVGGSNRLFVERPRKKAIRQFYRITSLSLKQTTVNKGHFVVSGLVLIFSVSILFVPSYFFESYAYSLILAVLVTAASLMITIFGRRTEWLDPVNDAAFKRYKPNEVQAVQSVFRLLPLMTLAIPFWSSYNLMATAFVTQACQMNHHVGHFTVGPSVAAVANPIAVLCSIPLLQFVVYPGMKKRLPRIEIYARRRISFGYIIISFATLSAAVIEVFRRNAPVMMIECTDLMVEDEWCDPIEIGTMIPEFSSCYEIIGTDTTKVVLRDLHLAWQFLPYSLIGLAEVLFAITYCEIFYNHAPGSLRSTSNAIMSLMLAFGALLSGVINSLLIPWIPQDLDQGHQEYMYLVYTTINLSTCLFYTFYVPIYYGKDLGHTENILT